MANWFCANKMAVNISKTKYIIFHTKGKKINNFDNNSIVFDENEIGGAQDPALVTPLGRIYDAHPSSDQKSYKLLGIFLDETLSFNSHAKFLTNKLSKALFCLNRAKNFLDAKNLKMLYYALFHSNLLYCIGPLSGMSSSNSTKILKIQKKAVRQFTNSKNRNPSNPLFYELKILPYNLLQKQAKLHFMHSIEYKYAPSTFQEVWQKNEDRNLNYELRNNNLFSLPKVNLASLKHLPFSPTLLNGIFWVIYASRTIKPPSKLTSNITYWKNCLPPPPTHYPLPPLLRPPPSLPSNNFSSPKHPQLTLCPPYSLYLLIPNPTPYSNFFFFP